MSYGANLKFGIARQAAANSWVTSVSSFHGIALTSEDVGLEANEVISQNLTGTFNQGASYQGTSKVNGTISFEVTPRNIAAFLAATFNNSAPQVTSASVNRYTFLPNVADFNSQFVNDPWTVYKQWADSSSAELFYDCQFSQLEFDLSQGQFFKAKATVSMGTRLPTGIGSMNVAPDVADVTRLYPWNVTSVSYGGAGMSTASDLTISVNENIDALFSLNASLAPLKATRTGFREVTVNGTFYMNDRSILNNFVNNVQAQLLVTMASTIAAIQSGYYNFVTIDIPQLKITAFKPGTSGPGEVSVKFTGRGILDPTSAYVMQAIVQNSYASGY